MFLVLPLLSFLGYDIMNPDEVCPEHNADFSEKYKNRVDFAIMKNDAPVIAIECKARGAALKDDRGQLRSYFNAAPTVKMGVITDGLVYEFYADSDEPNMMDANAFLTFNLNEVSKGKIEDSVVDGLKSLHKDSFDPENIGAEAKRKLVFQNLVQQIEDLSTNPSEPFVRLLLQNIGMSHVRSKAMAEYIALTQGAFGEFVNIRILRRLDLPSKDKEVERSPVAVEAPKIDVEIKPDNGIITTELEISVYEHTKRRLAFLAKTDDLYESIENIEYRDYKGKFIVFYKKERAGRIFDFYEDKEKKYTFDFGEEFGGIVSTDNIIDIDATLLAVFSNRVEAVGATKKAAKQKG
ncbi:type I restriction enzyme HsdR N-terminal domain-containing protein [Gluconobacter albidus]|uniref:type I restriction endonuclease n=1 Tax=Gluconobacter albidus TaxID=318683 RepID=UPI00209CEBF9|nr:type I restriction endonuclease [Gluconobacter albidus]MCP1274813.1 type I restriction enzyme HsdR N-terminal domain-containing protein [Gluconobacter albidus]